MLKELKRIYLLNNNFVNVKKISNEEYGKLPPEEQSNCTTNYGYHEYKTPINISDEELKKVIELQSANDISDMKKNISTIKNCLVFFVILTIFEFVAALLMVFNLFD